MKKKKELSTTGDNSDAGNDNTNSTHDDGDLISDRLKAEPTTSTYDSTNWFTGIVEVQLPVEYKLKNIEETEKAKRELQQQEKAYVRDKTDDSFANIRYQTDRAQKQRTTINGNEKATDELVMDRFKKRFRK